MKRLSNVLFTVSVFVLAVGTSSAAQFFSAIITHDQEPPPTGAMPLLTASGAPRPLSFGTAFFALNDAETEFMFTATIFNIDVTGSQTADTNDNLVAAHIHVGAPFGANAPVRWGFFGTPFNDNNPTNLVITPFLNGIGGTFTSIWNAPEGNATTLAAELAGIRAGLAYINFHTVQFGGGEIRGQILPEPQSIALIAMAALTACFARRRVRR